MAHAAVDGMDVLAVEGAARHAVEQVRGTGRPFLLEARTYRFRAHSMYDAELYRPREEVERWKRRDPIDLLTTRLRAAALLDDAALQAVEAAAAGAIEAAVAAAEAAAWEPVQDLLRDVVAPVPAGEPHA